MYSCLTFALMVIICCLFIQGSQASEEFNNCSGCPGNVLTYKCTVPGGVSTVWQGSAIGCTGNRISLLHSDYTPSSSAATVGCNNGAAVGQILHVDLETNHYTSLLNVTASMELNNQTIECLYYDSQLILIKEYVIMVITEPVPPPSNVHLSEISFDQLTFSWSPVGSACSAVHYILHTLNCGRCHNITTHTTMTCTDVIVDGRTCTFYVQSTVCGNITGNISSPVVIVLKVSDPPSMNVVPYYYSGVLMRLVVSTSEGNSRLPTLDQDNVNYTITYADSASGSSCGSAIIVASPCIEEICSHSFNVTSSSCSSSASITVTIFTTNPLGAGAHSDPIKISGSNKYVDIKFDADTSTFLCNFLNQEERSENICSVKYESGIKCHINQLQRNNQKNSSNNSVAVKQLNLLDNTKYCYSVTASNGTFTVVVMGTIYRGGFSNGAGSLSSLLNIYIISGTVLTCVLIIVIIFTVIFKSKRIAQRRLNRLQAPPNHIYEDLGEIQEIDASDIDKNIAYVSVSVPCSHDNN